MMPGSLRQRLRLVAVSAVGLATVGCTDSPAGEEAAVTSSTVSPVTSADSLPTIPAALGYTSGFLAVVEGTLVFEVKGEHLCVYLRREGGRDLLVLFDNPVVTRSPEGFVITANGAESLRDGDTISTNGGSVREDILAGLDLGNCDGPNFGVVEIGILQP